MINLNILYEDNHLIIVEKPRNIPTQSDSSEDRDLFSLVKSYIKEKYNKPGNVYLGLLHRLDRPVGGIIVFAKTSKAAGRMTDLIKKRQLKKTYLAVVEGIVENDDGILIDYLYKDTETNIVEVVGRNHPEAKEAILEYIVLDKKANYSLLQIDLQTGRSHQIRVQLSNIGHPIVGDNKYGNDTSNKTDNIALWAYKIEFKHPVTAKIIMLELLPPMQSPWDLFRIN